MSERFIHDRPRSHHNSELRASDVGANVVLMGWVNGTRDHGGTIFVDLRDKRGVTQVRFDPSVSTEAHRVADALRSEDCIAVEGEVVHRGENVNPKLETGEIEVWAKSIEVFSKAKTPPFPISDEIDAGEALRLKYRYLDLRRQVYQRAIAMRSGIVQSIRASLHEVGFLDIETPILTKSTPEGARDYLVPSRVHPGEFFALPQSPQIFKQLLMISGFERYYQIARCFRDEDLRADRQPEFTQLDLEMSFVGEAEVFAVVEACMAAIVQEAMGAPLPLPFPRMSHAEAVARFGTDKPDTRFALELADISALVADVEFKVFSGTVKKGGMVSCLAVPGGATAFSRSALDSMPDIVSPYGAKGLAWVKLNADGWSGPIAKFLPDDVRQGIAAQAGAGVGDLIFFVADQAKVVRDSLAALRNHLGRTLELIDDRRQDFLWVTDFPMFDKAEGGWTSSHHPFTSPAAEALDNFDSDPAAAGSQAYDLVLNGVELGSGSVRIHDPEVQARVFRTLGISDEEAKDRFGFFLEALSYGTPPHAGIALGIDRIAMLMAGADSLREVTAFPKTQRATCLMSETPSTVDPDQLQELHIKVR